MNMAQKLRGLATPLRKPVEVDELQLRKRMERGARAHALLEDELLKEGFERLAATYLHIWDSSDPFAQDERERAWIARRILSELRSHLVATMQDGDAARAQIEKFIERGPQG